MPWNPVRRIAAVLILLAPAADAAAQGFEPYEAGAGSGRALCRVGGTVGTITDEFEDEPESGTAECMTGFGGTTTQAVSAITFLPAIADAVALAERTGLEAALQVNARGDFDFVAFLLPIGEPTDPPFGVPIQASIGYSLASLIEGNLTGGCTARITVSQRIGGLLFFDSAEFMTTRVDGVPETGQLDVNLDADPDFPIDVSIEAVCGGTSDPLDGDVTLETHAQVGQLTFDAGLPLEPIPIMTSGDEQFRIIYFAPEPGAAETAAACVAALAWLRRSAMRAA